MNSVMKRIPHITELNEKDRKTLDKYAKEYNSSKSVSLKEETHGKERQKS